MTGKDLRYIRFRQCITQEFAANMVGVSRFALAGYESGRADMPITTALRLNKLYNLSAEDVDTFMCR